MDINETISDRGFIHLDPIPTTYGHEVRAYESSSASGPHIWLDITQTEETMRAARTNIEPESATAHMSLEQAELLHAQLGHLIERSKEAWA